MIFSNIKQIIPLPRLKPPLAFYILKIQSLSWLQGPSALADLLLSLIHHQALWAKLADAVLAILLALGLSTTGPLHLLCLCLKAVPQLFTWLIPLPDSGLCSNATCQRCLP